MKLRYLTPILFLFGTTLFAQNPLDPGWLWAKRGGSTASLGSLTYEYNNERIVDVAVDADNNYYYLAEVGGHIFTLDTMEFDTYNYYPNRKEIFIFSTDSDGNYRWSKVIGGGTYDYATSLGLDAQGNVYVSGACWNLASYPPVHFDTDTTLAPGTMDPSPANKKIFIVKYDSEGNFQWLRQPESDETPLGTSGLMLKMIVEPDGTTHSLIALIAGTYFDGQLVISPMDTIGSIIPTQSMIIKYDGDGVFEGYMLIDMKPIDGIYNFQLAYDPNLDRYYIGDTGRGHQTTYPPSINGYGSGVIKGFYLAAVDNEGDVIWYRENQLNGAYAAGDIALDGEGNIYFTGKTGAPDSFAGYIFDQEGGATTNYNPFLIKLDSDGNLLWGTNAELASPFPGQSIIIKGNSVYLGLGMLYDTWDGLEIPGPLLQGYVPDIQIIRFDAQTGTAQEVIHNNELTPTRDAIMAMALDNNGDLVVGGYFGSSLFYGTDLYIHNNAQDSDFFIAKYRPDTTLGIAENMAVKTIRAYPNPTTGRLKLRSDIALNVYSLCDLQGRVVARGRTADNQIDLSGLEAGVYVLRLHDLKGGIINFKVVKE